MSKRSLLVDGRGIPLSRVVSGAQKHSLRLLKPTLDHILVKRPPQVKKAPKQHLCADKAYMGKRALQTIESRN